MGLEPSSLPGADPAAHLPGELPASPTAPLAATPAPAGSARADSFQAELRRTARRRASLMASTVCDGVFLLVFAAVNYGVNVLISRMTMSTIDLYAFRVLQVLLAVSTVGVAAVYLAADTVEAMRRAFGRSRG